MFAYRRFIIFTIVFMVLSTGCAENLFTSKEAEDPEDSRETISVNPVGPQPVEPPPPQPQPVVVDPVAEAVCKVGDVLSPGESCIDPGTGDTFRVLANGSGNYLFITAGAGIDLQGNINGKLRNFKATRKGDTWKIEKVTPK